MSTLNLFAIGFLTYLLLCTCPLKAQTITPLQHGKPTSIRGLSVVNDYTAWLSGSHGYFAITKDGGKTWNWQQIKGFEKADFRDIDAFSDKEAIMMSAGTPALVLKTTDSGRSWQVKYHNADTAYFFDAMDFDTHRHGLILGDPIGGKFVLMETFDGGEHWVEYKKRPDALPGEAAFAASGTCLRISKNFIALATGGTNARLINFNKTTGSWHYHPLPIVHQKASQGAFAFATTGQKTLIVGGDYTDDKKTDSVAAIAQSGVDGGGKYTAISNCPLAFQSCIEYISGNTFLATGTSGTNITTDGGATWISIDTRSYNVCKKAKYGKLVLLAGDGGNIGILKM